MSDQYAVNKIGTENQQDYNYQILQAQQSAATAATNIKNVEQSEKKSETQKDKSEEERNKEKEAMRALRDVEMNFDVDQDTNEVTLTIVDKETQKIIRTIPERTWGELSVAELFKITA